MAEEEKTPETEAETESETEEKAETTEEIKNIVTIEDTGPCKKKILVEIPEEKIKSALNEQYDELKKDSVVPGFRKGRAPLRLLEKRFGSDVGKQVKLKLMLDASESALKDAELDTLGDPDIDHEKVEMPDSGALKFDFEVEVRPEFELPELEGIAVETTEIKITDKQVEEQILNLQKQAGIWAPKEDGAVEDDDQVIADVELTIEGVEEIEKLDNTEIMVRKSGFVGPVPVEELDKLLAGAKHNDVKKTEIDIPKTFYNEQYRGKKIGVEITVKEIKQLEPAELNEEFFMKYGFETKDELSEAIREARLTQAQRDVRSAMAGQVYEYLLEKTKFDLPADVVAAQSMQLLQRQYSNLLMQGTERSKVDERMGELRASSEGQAKQQLKILFIMDKIAEKFDINVNEEEINGHIAQVAAQRGRRPEKMREELLRDGSLAQFSLQVREQKCVEKILESAKITEVKAKAEPKAKKKAAKKTANEG